MELTIEFRERHSRTKLTLKRTLERPFTLGHLIKRIFLLTFIRKNYWQLFDKDEKEMIGPRGEPLRSFGVGNGSTVIVKHKKLHLYDKYIRYRYEDENEAAKLLFILQSSYFFTMYPSLDANWQGEEPISMNAPWTWDTIVKIERATEEYFQKLHDERKGNENSQFTCYFGDHNGFFKCGSISRLAYVQIHGEATETKYNVKTGSSEEVYADLHELFCYKLLELMGVGPKTHIILPTGGVTVARQSAYIATEFDKRFKYIDCSEEKNIRCVDFVVQRRMIELLLYSGSDLEACFRCGKWNKTNNLAVVEICPESCPEPWQNIKRSLLCYNSKPGSRKKQRKFEDDNSFLKRAKKYFDKWDMVNNINLALEHLGRYKGYHYFVRFLDTLDENIENLEKVFDSVVGDCRKKRAERYKARQAKK